MPQYARCPLWSAGTTDNLATGHSEWPVQLTSWRKPLIWDIQTFKTDIKHPCLNFYITNNNCFADTYWYCKAYLHWLSPCHGILPLLMLLLLLLLLSLCKEDKTSIKCHTYASINMCKYLYSWQAGFSVSGATVWNDLPPHITSAPSLVIFRQRLKSFSVSYTHLTLPTKRIV